MQRLLPNSAFRTLSKRMKAKLSNPLIIKELKGNKSQLKVNNKIGIEIDWNY